MYGGFTEAGDYTSRNSLWLAAVSDLLAGAGGAAWQLVHPSRAVLDSQSLLTTPLTTLLPNASSFGVESLEHSPGPRSAGGSWILDEWLYVFGGAFKTEGGPLMADLWRWNVRTGAGWTLVAGSVIPDDPAPLRQHPSARMVPTCWASPGQLWLFGGQAPTGEWLGDLWRFDVTGALWTLMQPTGEAPRGRSGAVSFSTAGRLWLYGGVLEQLVVDDMYHYDIARNAWATVIAPSRNDSVQRPIYSQLGAPNDVTALVIPTPAARALGAGFSMSAAGADPQFWLLGGSSAYNLYWNDVWAFKCYCK